MDSGQIKESGEPPYQYQGRASVGDRVSRIIVRQDKDKTVEDIKSHPTVFLINYRP